MSPSTAKQDAPVFRIIVLSVVRFNVFMLCVVVPFHFHHMLRSWNK